jgi:hypothetical protein
VFVLYQIKLSLHSLLREEFIEKVDYLKTEVVNEGTRVLQHIAKNALCAHGGVGNPGFNVSGNIIEIRQDVKGCAPIPEGVIPTPSNYSDDVIARYEFDLNAHEIRYYPEYNIDSSDFEVLSKKLKEFNFIVPDPTNTNTIDVRIVLLKDPSIPEDSKENPKAELETTVYGYGISLQ